MVLLEMKMMMVWDLYWILGFMFSWVFSMGIVNGLVLIIYGLSFNIFYKLCNWGIWNFIFLNIYKLCYFLFFKLDDINFLVEVYFFFYIFRRIWILVYLWCL